MDADTLTGHSVSRNLRVLLPDGHVGVKVYAPHPCGGWYVADAWVYGPKGRVGMWLD